MTEFFVLPLDVFEEIEIALVITQRVVATPFVNIIKDLATESLKACLVEFAKDLPV